MPVFREHSQKRAGPRAIPRHSPELSGPAELPTADIEIAVARSEKNAERVIQPACVSVGLIHEGVPQLGAVYVPRLDELFWAVRGQGAFCNGVPVRATDRNTLHVEDTICFTSNSLKTLNPEAIAGRIRSLGSIAIELLYTARGNLTAAVGLREGIIDIAAALCVCFEAGCEFRYLTGEPVSIPWLLDNLRTNRHFLYGPPRLLDHLQILLHPR